MPHLPTTALSERSNKQHTNVRKRIVKTCSGSQCCSGQAITLTYSECVFVVLVIQHVKRMRLIILSRGLSGSTIFSTLSHKRHDFKGRGVFVNIKCVF